MPIPSDSELHDNNTDYISSATYNSGTKTLTIVFADDLNPIQQATALMQSWQKWLSTNTDNSINMAASNPTRNTSNRNGATKDQINYSFQVFVPPAAIDFDPTTV